MSNAIKITIDRTVTVVPFPKESTKQYRLASDTVTSDTPKDHGLVEQVSFRINRNDCYILVNEEGMMRGLPYNGLATFMYLDSLAGRKLRYTPILVGDTLIVGKSKTGEWAGISDKQLPGILAVIDQIKADIEGARAAVIEGLS